MWWWFHVGAAYKCALLIFHSDRASNGNMCEHVESEESLSFFFEWRENCRYDWYAGIPLFISSGLS